MRFSLRPFRISIPKRLWLYIGRCDYFRAWSFEIAWGWRDNRPECEIPWRHHWRWTPNLPRIIWRQYSAKGFSWPVGIQFAGRQYMLPQ